MTEFTLCDIQNNEVMINVENDGTVTGIYTFKDCKVNYVAHQKSCVGNCFDLSQTWKIVKNSLFRHCAKNKLKTTIKRLLENDNMFYFTLDSDEEDFKEKFEIITKLFLKYSIKTDITDIVNC